MKLSLKIATLPTTMVDYYLEKTEVLQDTLLAEEANLSPEDLRQLIGIANAAVVKKTLAEHLPAITESGFFQGITSWERYEVEWTDELRFLYFYEVFHGCLVRTLAEDQLAGRRDIKGTVERFRDMHDLRVASEVSLSLKDVPEGVASRLRATVEEVSRVNVGTMLGDTNYNIWKALDYSTQAGSTLEGLEPLLRKLNPMQFVLA
jgi:hypothetical protein